MRIKNAGVAAALVAVSWAYPCKSDALEHDDEVVTSEAEASLQAVEVLGVVEQNDKVLGGRWMKSRVTLRDDGKLIGETELKNSNSVFGFTGQLIVVLVDENRQILHHVEIDSWGINACFFRCPKKRHATWERQVSSDEWARIGAQVRGMALVHRHNPTNRVIDWILGNKDVVISLVRLF